jgi:hypothetical protein
MMDSVPVSGRQLPDSLILEMASMSAREVPADFSVLVDELIARFGGALDAVILYGSCLRSQDAADGVVDFYVVVDDYSHAYPEHYLRHLNAWLAPNVFYLEASDQEKKFRAKYAVVSMADFEQGTRDWFHPYLWARFAQPTRLMHVRDDVTRHRIHHALAHAVVTFLGSTIPTLGSCTVTAEEIWTKGLSLTYAAELRAERETRARQLTQLNLDDYTRLTAQAMPMLIKKIEAMQDGSYRCLADESEQQRSLRNWRLRRWQGRILSVLRLTKAAFTFRDCVSYAAWKIERHTGVHVEITPMLRRHPVLWGYKVFWQLLRRGVLR